LKEYYSYYSFAVLETISIIWKHPLIVKEFP